MSYNDFCHGGSCCSRVLVLTSMAKLPRNVKEKNTPTDVVLPRYIEIYLSCNIHVRRSLWLFVSYFLNLKDFGANVFSTDEDNAPLSKADIMLYLLREIYERDLTTNLILHDCESVPLGSQEARPTPEETKCDSLYDILCYVILGRAINRKDLRPFANYLLTVLPSVPLLCIHLLERLTHTGPSGTSSAHVSKRREREKSLRVIAMEMLGNTLQVHRDHIDTAAPCLNALLWCSVAKEFEYRSRAVALLAGYGCEYIKRVA